MGLTSQFGDAVTVVFPESVDTVWRVVSDVERIGEWSPECVGIAWIDPATGPAVGARFVGRNKMGLLRWRTTCTVVDWQPQRRFSYDARHATGAVTRWTFDLAPAGSEVAVTQTYQTLGSPGYVIAVDRLTRRPTLLRLGMQETLAAMGDAMKAHAVEP